MVSSGYAAREERGIFKGRKQPSCQMRLSQSALFPTRQFQLLLNASNTYIRKADDLNGCLKDLKDNPQAWSPLFLGSARAVEPWFSTGTHPAPQRTLHNCQKIFQVVTSLEDACLFLQATGQYSPQFSATDDVPAPQITLPESEKRVMFLQSW